MNAIRKSEDETIKTLKSPLEGQLMALYPKIKSVKEMLESSGGAVTPEIETAVNQLYKDVTRLYEVFHKSRKISEIVKDPSRLNKMSYGEIAELFETNEIVVSSLRKSAEQVMNEIRKDPSKLAKMGYADLRDLVI